MQIIKNPKGGGRKPGSLSQSTIRKNAIKLIEQAVSDETLPMEIRVQAALKLVQEMPNRKMALTDRNEHE